MLVRGIILVVNSFICQTYLALLTAHVCILLYLFSFLLIPKGALAGILRGCGHQNIGAVGNFVAFYVIGLPLGISLALFVHMGALGMWLGLLAASLTQASNKWCMHTCIHVLYRRKFFVGMNFFAKINFFGSFKFSGF